MVVRVAAALACVRTFCSDGTRIEISSEMMDTTVSNSTRVKPRCRA